MLSTAITTIFVLGAAPVGGGPDSLAKPLASQPVAPSAREVGPKQCQQCNFVTVWPIADGQVSLLGPGTANPIAPVFGERYQGSPVEAEIVVRCRAAPHAAIGNSANVLVTDSGEKLGSFQVREVMRRWDVQGGREDARLSGRVVLGSLPLGKHELLGTLSECIGMRAPHPNETYVLRVIEATADVAIAKKEFGLGLAAMDNKSYPEAEAHLRIANAHAPGSASVARSLMYS